LNKLYILLLLCFIASINSSRGCEICGCGHSDFQIGLLPTFNKGFLGYRYNYSRFSSRVKDEPGEFSNDYYQTMELWGGYNYRKIQMMAFMPYAFSKKVSDDGTTKTNGLGDLMFLVNYKVLSSTFLAKNERTTIAHELYVGGGIKLPTGVNRVDVDDADFNIGDFNSQGGTGSVDYIVNVTHNFMWNDQGVITNVAYRINTANKDDYRFGNRTYLNTSYFRTFTKSETKIRPNVGINYQSNQINKFEGVDVEHSNGYTFNSTIGLNLIKNKVGFNTMAFIPFIQNNYDRQTQLKGKVVVGLTFSI
jgi:hypothetical protein